MDLSRDNYSTESSEDNRTHTVAAAYSDVSSLEDGGVDSAAIYLQELLPKVAQTVARMEVTSPEILRVTYAYQALRRCGRVLRPDFDGSVHHLSWQSKRISTFWSHSWHGGYWPKLLTLMTFYNSRAAIVLGMLGAVVMMVLHALGYVPDIIEEQSNSVPLVGTVVTILTTILWQPTAQVFLDRICIGSTDEVKTKAIFSLAGFLKRSESMLILWDPTWTQRLWCLFEFGAFLKSKEASESAKQFSIRPTIIGCVSIGCFCLFALLALVLTSTPTEGEILLWPLACVAVCAVATSYPAAKLMRVYFRSLDVMESELTSLSFSKTRSSCCDLNHVNPAGQVSIWFGSEKAFEESVRKDVLKFLKQELGGRAFTSEWAIGVTIPVVWADMGLAASYARLEMWERAAAYLVDGAVLALVMVPATAQVMIQICRLHRHEASTSCREIGSNFLVIVLCVLPVICCMVLYLSASFMIYIPVRSDGQGTPLLPSAVYFLSMVVQRNCSWLLVQRWQDAK